MSLHHNNTENRFISFQEDISKIPLPKRLNFPFYYEPHPLCLQAAKELQDYLKHQKEWDHNFGIDPNKEGLVIGKMFGVLVVENQQKEIGYLAAVSGKLAGKNQHRMFVPPIFDMLTKNSFFQQEEAILNEINRRIETLENQAEYLAAKRQIDDYKKKHSGLQVIYLAVDIRE
jgi:tRNA pseudouridine32 synthase/23S rRNA pseudouridine746 synthase